MNLGICVVILHPLDVNHNHLPACVLKGEMAEGLRGISVLFVNIPKVVAVFFVRAFQARFHNHNWSSSCMVSWPLDKLHNAAVNEVHLLGSPEGVELLRQSLATLLHHHSLEGFLSTFVPTFGGLGHFVLFAFGGRQVGDIVHETIRSLRNDSRIQANIDRRDFPFFGQVIVGMLQNLLGARNLSRFFFFKPIDQL